MVTTRLGDPNPNLPHLPSPTLTYFTFRRISGIYFILKIYPEGVVDFKFNR